jgi:acylglycerol lipase
MDYSVIQAGKFIRLCTYRQYNKSLGPPKGLLVMFHGLNSHIGHGAHIAHAFQEIGIVTVGFDHRGFGNSEGVKGYIDSLDLHL